MSPEKRQRALEKLNSASASRGNPLLRGIRNDVNYSLVEKQMKSQGFQPVLQGSVYDPSKGSRYDYSMANRSQVLDSGMVVFKNPAQAQATGDTRGWVYDAANAKVFGAAQVNKEDNPAAAFYYQTIPQSGSLDVTRY